VRLLLLAPPGAGKGTQGTRLAAHFGIRHIAAGDLFREEIEAGTDVGRLAAGYVDRGELVPDSVVIDLLMPHVVAAAAEGGYILDGFPRSVSQATTAAEMAKRLGIRLDAAVYLPVEEEELVQRLLARAQVEGRADDTPEVIRNRLRLYAEETAPLVFFYRGRGILVEVDGGQPVDEVFRRILAELDRVVGVRGTS
jgi:adenylate kinase